MNTFPNINNEELEELLVIEETSIEETSFLIVYNDDHNTFDWVIQCFVEICNHTFEQSEQLSLMIHYKGKATIKTAPLDVLRPMKDSLVSRGLSAVIETVVKK
jgi:ATP-dependent Clp protease adaptor protein ClpS